MWELIKSIFDPNYIPIYVVIIGGLITLYQVRGNTISNARIAWIENFRKSIAEYCESADKIVTHITNIVSKAKEQGNVDYNGFEKDYENLFRFNNENYKISLMIKLYLNPGEEKAKKIIRQIDIIEQLILNEIDNNKTSISNLDIKDNLNEIVKISNLIIKEEWEKAKSYFYKLKKKFNEFKKEYNSLN